MKSDTFFLVSKMLIFRLKENKKNILDTILKGDLKPKLQPCFYCMFLLILSGKNLAKNYVVF